MRERGERVKKGEGREYYNGERKVSMKRGLHSRCELLLHCSRQYADFNGTYRRYIGV